MMGRSRSSSCDALAASGATAVLPAYCDWYGLDCCNTTMKTKGECSTLGTVQTMALEANQVNGSISDQPVFGALEQLHSCGMTKVILSGNE